MIEHNPMEAMLKVQRERAMAKLAADPEDRMAKLLVANREQALADLAAEHKSTRSTNTGADPRG